jgi:CubicO group peptidase (beta-lactamase class C family)
LPVPSPDFWSVLVFVFSLCSLGLWGWFFIAACSSQLLARRGDADPILTEYTIRDTISLRAAEYRKAKRSVKSKERYADSDSSYQPRNYLRPSDIGKLNPDLAGWTTRKPLMLPILRFRVSFALLMLAAISRMPLSVFAEDSPAVSTKSVAAVLQPFVDKHALAGAVTLVADKDKVLSLDAIGFTDVAAQKPMPPDALFWIASQTKSFTATALMMLVDEGKVKLDDPVEKYLPEFKGQWVRAYGDNQVQLLKKPKQPMTVRHILSHTCGLPFKSAMEEPTLDLLPLHVAVQSYVMTPLSFEPGTKLFQYSNPGINIAGRIIEVVSGMAYEKFLDKRLLQPLGMKDTTFWPTDEQLKRLAKSYKPNDDKCDLEETKITFLKYPLNDRKRYAFPGGGLFSTAAEVGRFCQMVLNGGTFQGKRYLSEKAVKQMATTQIGDPAKGGYGLGWSTHGVGVFGHGGAQATNMTIDTNRGLVTVFMVQHAGFPKDGSKSQAAFHKAALERFSRPQK